MNMCVVIFVIFCVAFELFINFYIHINAIILNLIRIRVIANEWISGTKKNINEIEGPQFCIYYKVA